MSEQKTRVFSRVSNETESKKQSQVITLVFDCDNKGDPKQVFNEMLNVTISNPDGFYVRQISCTSGYRIISIEQKSGELYNPQEGVDIPDGVISSPVTEIGTQFFNIYTDLVNNHIGCITSGSTVCPGTYFKLTKSNINDKFMFRIDALQQPSVTAINTIILVLEFIKN